MRGGILVDKSFRDLIARSQIAALVRVKDQQIQPSSLDLRLGARLWQLQCSFLPGPDGADRKLARLATAVHRLDRDDAIVLHRGCVYLAEVEEHLDLPAEVWGRGNPKSTTGRLDVFVRLLTEHGQSYDTIPTGYRGRLFIEITPLSFHVAVRRGDTLCQLRLGRGDPGIPASEVSRLYGQPSLLSVDLNPATGPAGYTARRNLPPVDLQRRDLPIDRYWSALPPSPNEGHVLEPEQFYVFATRELLSIPPDLCVELVAFDATKGELRTHYAGFIDSGFGWDPTGKQPGAQLVLEIRTHDVPFLLEHGQPLFRLEFMRNEETPGSLYGDVSNSNNYQMQGLRLAKQFGGQP